MARITTSEDWQRALAVLPPEALVALDRLLDHTGERPRLFRHLGLVDAYCPADVSSETHDALMGAGWSFSGPVYRDESEWGWMVAQRIPRDSPR